MLRNSDKTEFHLPQIQIQRAPNRSVKASSHNLNFENLGGLRSATKNSISYPQNNAILSHWQIN